MSPNHSRPRAARTVSAAVALGLALAALPASAAAQADSVEVGYGTMKKQSVTGAISSLEFGTHTRMPVARVEEMIAGRFPGVEVFRRTNGDYSIRIRGTRSFMGDGEPLIVVDGVPLSQGIRQPLLGLSPHDIARIDVLKDGGSTAIYGSRGANGVILITTRRPGR